MKTILVLICFLWCSHGNATTLSTKSFSSLEEFSNDLKPKLTTEEKALLEPVIISDEMWFKFKQDGTIKGVRCTKGVLIGGYKHPWTDVHFLGQSLLSTRPPYPFCKYKDFEFNRETKFTKDGFILRMLSFDYDTPGINPIKDVKARSGTQLYFGQEKIAEGRLKRAKIKSKKFYVTQENIDERLSFSALILEPFNLFGLTFPKGSEVHIFSHHEDTPDVQDEVVDIISWNDSLSPVKISGFPCNTIFFAEGKLAACQIQEDIKLQGVSIPAKTMMTFDLYMEGKIGTPVPAVISDWPKNEKLDSLVKGKKKILQFKDGKLTSEGAVERKVALDASRRTSE